MNKRRGFTKPAFLSDLAPITVTEGDTLQAKVIISGEPAPYAKWYINNQLVYQTEDTQITNENGVYSLVIHGCTTDMTGTIKCVAGNKMGEASTEGKLTVIRAIPVEFETSLCDAVCREGDTLKLKAVLVGEPMPEVSWFVNGKKLEESQNIKIHADKGTYTVTIKDITCDYSGKVADNEGNDDYLQSYSGCLRGRQRVRKSVVGGDSASAATRRTAGFPRMAQQHSCPPRHDGRPQGRLHRHA